MFDIIAHGAREFLNRTALVLRLSDAVTNALDIRRAPDAVEIAVRARIAEFRALLVNGRTERQHNVAHDCQRFADRQRRAPVVFAVEVRKQQCSSLRVMPRHSSC